jgi:Flp pilus assembly protein TadD
LLLWPLAVFYGCAAVTPPRLGADDEAWLLSGRALPADIAVAESIPDEDLLALTPEMRRFAEAAVEGRRMASGKIRALLSALLDPSQLALQYDGAATYTAEETFAHGRANCLSFTALYIALARHVGLKAYFQEVEVPPTWDLQGRDTLVLYRHVNAVIPVRRGYWQVVDLDSESYDTTYPQHGISDQEALAQHYNNRAAGFLAQQDLGTAQQYLAKAISIDPDISYLWGNLGVLYKRAGQYRAAELALHKAIRLDRRNLVAISNAASLYAELGRQAEAQRLERQAAYFRSRNPYHRYLQGQRAFEDRQYEAARAHALAAVRLYRKEHRFHFLLGAAYQRLGDYKRAQASFARAIALTSDGEQISRYRQKRDLLMSAAGF